jgi:hypothetical protein
MLIGADRTKVPPSFLTQVESAASINVEAVIKAAFPRLRVWNNVAASVARWQFEPGRVQGFRGENGTVIPGRNWIDGFLT